MTTTKNKSKLTLWLEANESLIRWFTVFAGLVLIVVGETFSKSIIEFVYPWADKASKFNTNMTQMMGYIFILGPFIYKLAAMKLKAGKSA